MNRIGILTWKLRNFGTALQAFSLVNYINTLDDCCCNLLNSTLGSDRIVRVNQYTPKDYLKKILNRIGDYLALQKNKEYLEKFSSEIAVSNEKFKAFYELIPNEHTNGWGSRYFDEEYDKIIVGSDQVWSPKYFCDRYFLDFVPERKRFSYAPSLGVSSLTDSEKKYLKSKLPSFQKLSVREETARFLLQSILPDKQIEHVLDPSFLFEKNEWDALLGLSDKQSGKYVFVYLLSTNKWYLRFLKKISATNKLLIITPSHNIYFYKDAGELKMDAGPIDFVHLIRNAKAVVTDSFHGMCFSLIYKKQFVVLNRFGNNASSENSRITDILDMLHLKEGCWLNDGDGTFPVINYDEVDLLLNPQIDKSKKYISAIINYN